MISCPSLITWSGRVTFIAIEKSVTFSTELKLRLDKNKWKANQTCSKTKHLLWTIMLNGHLKLDKRMTFAKMI